MAQQRILLVDDDPGIRRTLQIALSQAGYQVIEAQDGREASLKEMLAVVEQELGREAK